MIKLNERVRDTVTGYEGVVTALGKFTTGYKNALVESVDSTGRPTEFWYDVKRLEKTEEEEDV